MKKLIIFIVALLLLVSCEHNTQYNQGYRYVDKYNKAFALFLANKYDGKYYSSDYTRIPDGLANFKVNYPDLYLEYIVPTKHIWDSLRFVPIELTLYGGLTPNILKYKLRIKEIEKQRIKIKKSDDVTITTSSGDNNIFTDSLIIQ